MLFKRFQILDFRKPIKIQVDKCSEFYNSSFKRWLKYYNIETHSTHNEGKSVVAEIFIRTLKNKVYKHMTSVSKYVYIDKLDDTVNEYNNTYHRTIKRKPIEVKDKTYVDSIKEFNDKNPKFKVGDPVRTLKYKDIFPKGCTPNWSEKVFVIKEVKNTVSQTFVINDLNGEEVTGIFYEKKLQKTNQQGFRAETVIKRK